MHQAHQAFGGFEPDPAIPMRDAGVITAQPVPATPETSGVNMGETIAVSDDGGGQALATSEAPAPEAVPDPTPDPVPDPAPIPEAVPDPPQVVTPIEVQQCVPPTAAPPQDPPAPPRVGFQPHKAGAWS